MEGVDLGLRADDFEERLEVRMRRRFQQLCDATQHFTTREGDFHARADDNRIHHFRRNGIVELLAQGYFQRHAGDHAASKEQFGGIQKEIAREVRASTKIRPAAMIKSMSQAVQYLTDESGKKTAVVLPILDYEKLLEDLNDLAAVAERRDEPAISHDTFVAELKRDGLV